VLDLAFLNQFLHGSCHVFDGHLRIASMLKEEVDDVSPQPLERTLDGLPDAFRPAVEPRPAPHAAGVVLRVEVDPEFRGEDHPIAERGQGLADQFFVRERAVVLGGVGEGDPALHGRLGRRDGGVLLQGGP